MKGLRNNREAKATDPTGTEWAGKGILKEKKKNVPYWGRPSKKGRKKLKPKLGVRKQGLAGANYSKGGGTSTRTQGTGKSNKEHDLFFSVVPMVIKKPGEGRIFSGLGLSRIEKEEEINRRFPLAQKKGSNNRPWRKGRTHRLVISWKGHPYYTVGKKVKKRLKGN